VSENKIEKIMDRILHGLGVKNQSQLAQALGITPARISNAKARGEIPPEWLVKLASEKELNPNWILTGKEPMRIGIDEVFLGRVIHLVEEYLEEIKKDKTKKGDGWLPPEKKAKLVVILYSEYVVNQDKLDRNEIDHLIDLAMQYNR